MKCRPHVGQIHSCAPDGSVPRCTISCCSTGGPTAPSLSPLRACTRVGPRETAACGRTCSAVLRTARPGHRGHEDERVAADERDDLEVDRDQPGLEVELPGQAIRHEDLV